MNPVYHTNVQSDDPFHPVEDSGHLMGREVLQHGSTPDIQYIFSQSIAAEAAYLPNSSVPTALPSAGGELDLTSFGLDLGTVDLSAQPPAGLTGGNQRFPTELPSSFLDHFPTAAQGAPAAVPNPPSNPFESTLIGPREGNWGSTTELPSSFLDHFPAAVPNPPSNPFESTFVDPREGNWGSTTEMTTDFLDHFPAAAQAAPLAVVDLPAGPLASTFVGQQEVDDNLEQTPSQMDRDFVEFLKQQGYDPDHFQFETQEEPSPRPNRRSRQSKEKKYLKDHAAAAEWDESKNGKLTDQTCGSDRVVWWLCKEGHAWQTSIASRCKGKTPSVCTKCKPKRYVKDHEAASQWDESKNGELKDQTCASAKVVWWLCQEGHEWQTSIANRCRRKTPSTCLVCRPRGKRITRYIRNQSAASQWDESKNGELKDQTCGSEKVVWWVCKEGHEWQASIASRCRRKAPSRCPVCHPRGKRITRYIRNHAAASQWDESKNGELKDQTCGSSKVVWWLCKKGHEWQASILSRCRSEKLSVCPKCKPRRYVKDHAAASQWDESKNGELKDQACSSPKEVWWRCNQGHEWQASILSRCLREKPTACPECNTRRKKPRRYLKDHAAASQWDVSKNGELKDQGCDLGKEVWWRCDQGHEWQTSILNRCRREKPTACPLCNTRRKKPRRYVKDHAAALEWDESKNGELKDQTCGSSKVVWWLCKEGHEWQASIHNRCKYKIPPSCVQCGRRKIAGTRYVKDHAAASQWDEIANGSIEGKSCCSREIVSWKCDAGHTWKASIVNRCVRKKAPPCPVCKPKKYVRDHAAASQWHESKNGELKDQTCGLSKVVWWLCKEGHEWQASIVSRCKAEKAPACPVCRPRRKRAAKDSLGGQPPKKRKRR